MTTTISSILGSFQLLTKTAADPVVASEESAGHSRNKINDCLGTIPNSKFRITEQTTNFQTFMITDRVQK